MLKKLMRKKNKILKLNENDGFLNGHDRDMIMKINELIDNVNNS